MPLITIIDYGIGNTLSVSRAFERCGAVARLSSNPAEVESAQVLVLPGVGAFANGMEGLRSRGLVEPIRRFAATGRPFLGICLGMQMMLDKSSEFGSSEGLGLIPGSVEAIPQTGVDGAPHKIPHIGWNTLVKPEHGAPWDDSILSDVRSGDAVYFVHSYTAIPSRPENRLADCLYDGRVISAAIRNANVYGCQFHPEKSGEVGLGIVRRFISIAGKQA